jgi:hypothetical protein
MKIGWMNRTKRSKLCYSCITIIFDETIWSVCVPDYLFQPNLIFVTKITTIKMDEQRKRK